MGFVATFIRFPAVQKIKNRLRFDTVTESLKVGSFLETQCSSAMARCCGGGREEVYFMWRLNERSID